MQTSRTNKLLGVLVPVAFVAAVVAACGGGTNAAPAKERICTPGNYVFCRCQNRDEGSKLCSEDGTAFGKCEPCETDENPGLPDPEPYVPPPPLPDGGPVTEPAECGDKISQPGEACDDGNTVATDGCDATCKLSGTDPPSSRTCPGMPVHLWGPTAVQYVGTTTGAPVAMSITPSCPSAEGNVPTSGATGGERLFAVTPHRDGLLRVATTDTDFNSYLFVTEACKAGSVGYLACTNKDGANGGETLSVPVQANKIYTVAVDGAGIDKFSGAFRVTFTLE